MEWYNVLALVGVGLVAGFINTVAGGGSTLTLPLLMFLGLPANVANGTNRIAILLQNVVGVQTFRKKKALDLKTDYRLAVPAVMGSIAGALVAVEISNSLMERIIAVLMVAMLVIIVARPDIWVKERAGTVSPHPSVWQYILFTGIGFYGGFIQMGVGFFLLAGLVLGCGHNLVRANAVKVFIVLIYTVFSLGIYFFHGQVDLKAGLFLAAGNMVGAWGGAHFTVRGGAKYVRYVLIAALVMVILKLFGVF
jgi:uncharacterized protein